MVTSRHGRIALVLKILLCSLITPARAVPTQAASQAVEHRAGLVVDFGEGRAVQRCVTFGADTVTGLDLLARSGLKLQTWGSAVCRVEGQGCDYPLEPCFCQCRGAPCAYWSYWHWQLGRWTYSAVGAAAYALQDGDIDGWAWGDGKPPAVVPSPSDCMAAGSTPPGGTAPALAPTQSRRPAGRDNSAPRAGEYVGFFVAACLLAGVLVLRSRRVRR